MRFRATALIAAFALGLLSGPPAAAGRRPAKVYRIGFLTSGSRLVIPRVVSGWLQEFGHVEGKNIAFEYRYAVGTDADLDELAADLVGLEVDVIVTEGTQATRAAKQATTRIPIVMVVESDPVGAGLIATLARPGGNITGVTALVAELAGKRLELLKEAAPGLGRVGVLWNPADPGKVAEWKETQAAARLLGLELQSLEVRRREDLESAFEAAVDRGASALLVLADALISGWADLDLVADFANKRRLPSIHSSRRFLGRGLMSYGPSGVELHRRVAVYVHKILKGAKPADLPVEQPRRFELVINLKTAKALGLTLPDSVLIRADKLIE